MPIVNGHLTNEQKWSVDQEEEEEEGNPNGFRSANPSRIVGQTEIIRFDFLGDVHAQNRQSGPDVRWIADDDSACWRQTGGIDCEKGIWISAPIKCKCDSIDSIKSQTKWPTQRQRCGWRTLRQEQEQEQDSNMEFGWKRKQTAIAKRKGMQIRFDLDLELLIHKYILTFGERRVKDEQAPRIAAALCLNYKWIANTSSFERENEKWPDKSNDSIEPASKRSKRSLSMWGEENANRLNPQSLSTSKVTFSTLLYCDSQFELTKFNQSSGEIWWTRQNEMRRKRPFFFCFFLRRSPFEIGFLMLFWWQNINKETDLNVISKEGERVDQSWLCVVNLSVCQVIFQLNSRSL